MDRKGIMWDIFVQTGSVGAYLLYKQFGDLQLLAEEQEADCLFAVSGEKRI